VAAPVADRESILTSLEDMLEGTHEVNDDDYTTRYLAGHMRTPRLVIKYSSCKDAPFLSFFDLLDRKERTTSLAKLMLME
jgi:hypothetical protein